MQFRLIKRIPYAAWLAMWLVAAVGLWFVVYPYQLNRGCWIGEWPFEQGCGVDRPTGFSVNDPETAYTQYLQRNPGNSFVYSWLALHRWKNNEANSEASLDTALRLMPIDAQVLAVHANRALRREEWAAAAASLIKLAETGNTDAYDPLLFLLTQPASQAVTLSLISKDAVWLDRLLRHANVKFPVDGLLPAFNHGKRLGMISAETSIQMIDKLLVAGRWLDAYSLWVNYQGSLKEGIFNGGFDSRVSQKAFDWKWPQSRETPKAMVVRQVSAYPDNGLLLELDLVGRTALPLPMVYQHVVLWGNNYVLKGRYLTDRLQMNEGLSWKLSCASGGEPWAQTEALFDTQKQWQTFELKFQVPATCGAAILLGLETKNRGEARVGISGLVRFDALSITAAKAP